MVKTLTNSLKRLFSEANVICSVFRHDCYDYKKLKSASYLKDGDSGVVFSLGKEYQCTKCGGSWHE